jgi:hypothetical protein
LGIVFCGGSILITISLLGKHWITAGVSFVAAVAALWLFVARWKKRGVFGSL